MSEMKGFWSYVHKDDSANSNRITDLARHLVDAFEMITGDQVEMFLDKDSIAWGDEWKNAIDGSLSSVAFFVPVITPRYFMSPECRHELRLFARRAEQLGVKDLVLPIYWVTTPVVEKEDSEDDLAKLVSSFQWEDWRDLRFKEVESEPYRRGVHKLASRLAEANIFADHSHKLAEDVEAPEDEVLTDEPGFIDRWADAEVALPQWTATLNSITASIEEVGEMMNESTREINRANNQGQGASARLAIARKLSKKLQPPVERIWSKSNEFTSYLYRVDDGLKAIIEQVPTAMVNEPESLASLCRLFGTIKGLRNSLEKGLVTTRQMIDATSPIERMSRDLRPILKKLREGLTNLLEADEISSEWIRLIDELDLDCDEVSVDIES